MNHKMYTLLLVEDDASLGYLLSEYLKMKGMELIWVQKASEVIPLLEQRGFDLLILDVMMPEMDGFTLGAEIHQRYPEIPFLFLTAKSMKIDVLKGFSVGAVDYLKKPIDEEELVVRIETLLSRLGSQEPDEVSRTSLGRYVYDPQNQCLYLDKEELSLTTRENELLSYLVRHQNRLCSHSDILKRLWGRNDYFNRKSLNVFITRLRKLLEKDPELRIENVHGQGFILRMPVQPK
ncbi:response regulator transcription factor [Robiginitalea aurantiaca]|uniref:Response regulator transcription factor n=1 Tax=Robiginitalea aurantiaca TaxID=3056915 RepID=A0ABT7WHF2_9FLAO|nr:response regulator transcription factor [Robiginitalea aurantiaca]MDM9632352.1 response regulator transcription factor [Robiginitalea aurantiaca]